MTDDQRPVEPRQSPPSPESPVGPENPRTGMALAGRNLGYASMVLIVVGIGAAILLSKVTQPREAARRASCAVNQKLIGLICKLHVNDHGGFYPELSREAGRLMFSNHQSQSDAAVYPEYMNDLDIFYCPSAVDSYESALAAAGNDHESLIDDNSYFYLGYAVTNDAEVEAFAEAYRARINAGEPFTDDLVVPEGRGNMGGSVILRLRENVARYFLTDISAPTVTGGTFPMLIERPDNHVPIGGNVLFMDGRVEFIPYPGKWPMTEKTIGILESLDALSPGQLTGFATTR